MIYIYVMNRLAHQFDLTRLNAFLAVAEEGSITAAAHRLSIAQPALSATIRRLESDLGQPLFARLPRGVALTQAGDQLLPRVYEIFGALESMRSELQTAQLVPRGEIAIGLPPSSAAVLLRPLLEMLSALYPQISVRIVEAMSGYLQDWVENGELDLAVGFNMADSRTLLSRQLFDEELMLIGATEKMLGFPDPFPIARLPEVPLILTSVRHSLRGVLEQQVKAMGKSLNIRFEIDAGHELVRLVAGGAGFGVFARSAFYDEIANDRVRAIPLTPSYSRRVCLYHHRKRSSDRILSLVQEAMTECAQNLRAAGRWHS